MRRALLPLALALTALAAPAAGQQQERSPIAGRYAGGALGAEPVLIGAKVPRNGQRAWVNVVTPVTCGARTWELETRVHASFEDGPGFTDMDVAIARGPREPDLNAALEVEGRFSSGVLRGHVIVHAAIPGRTGCRDGRRRPFAARLLDDTTPRRHRGRTLIGATAQTVVGRYPAPVLLRLAPDGRTVEQAVYRGSAHCARKPNRLVLGHARRLPVRGGRFAAGPGFAGRLTDGGAEGTVRVRAAAGCDSGAVAWSASS